MKRYLVVSAVALTLLAQTGCFTYHMHLKVKPDGSGTMVQKMAFSMEVMKSMAEDGEPAPEFDKEEMLADMEEAKAQASELGEGVTVESAEPIDTDQEKGFIVTYAFEDINKLMVPQAPAGQSAPMGGGEDEGNEVRFKLEKKGGHSVLTAILPPEEESEEPAAEAPEAAEGADEMADAMMEMMKQMFNGLRLAITVEVEGEILKCNTPHVDGTTVTIMDMDFGKLLNNEEAMKILEDHPQASMREMQTLLEGIEGIKIPPEDQVVIEFK